MGNATSRQKIAQPFLNAATWLTKRNEVWNSFVRLTDKLKASVGLGQTQKQVSNVDQIDTSTTANSTGDLGEQASHDSEPPRPDNSTPDDGNETDTVAQRNDCTPKELEPEVDQTPSVTAAPAPDSEGDDDDNGSDSQPQPDGSTTIDDPELVKKMQKALEEANPLFVAQPSADAAIIEENEPAPASTSPQKFSSREKYGTRLRAMETLHNRNQSSLSTERKGLPNSVPLDEYDNQVAEYIYSNLKVALPSAPVLGRSTGIAFQPSKYRELSQAAHTSPTSKDHDSTGAPSRDASNGQAQSSTEGAGKDDSAAEDEEATNADKASKSEPDVKDTTWDRRLYAQLPLKRSSIRLLDILPGQPDDVVSLRMTVSRHQDATTKYEALSYVWGEKTPRENVLVNGIEVSITLNLYDALVSLRDPSSERRIWIDAICLNQTDKGVPEKSREVQKMGDIYRRASKVDIYLGDPVRSGTTAIGSFFKFLNRDVEGQVVQHVPDDVMKTLEVICKSCGTNVQDVCRGFVEMCLQPWWGRVWTLQEFYLADQEPVWYWGKAHVSNASLKRDFHLFTNLPWDSFVSGDKSGQPLSDVRARISKPIGAFRIDVERISELITRRYGMQGYDSPRRLYRELTAQATDPKDYVYGLRAIFDPVFGKVFVPDYSMLTEQLFACLAVFLIQFECWGDVLWWYPARFTSSSKQLPSWLPDFSRHVRLHELDVRPQEEMEERDREPKLLVLDHCIHAEGYVLDKIYGHRHVDKSDSYKIFSELWQFDHCMNHNHKCHEFFSQDAISSDRWFAVFREMYWQDNEDTLKYFNSAFRGPLIQSTIRPEVSNKLPRHVVECEPRWDLLRWHAIRMAPAGLAEAIGDDKRSGVLEDVFSPRLDTIFREAFADFFIGACIYDWGHLSVWLRRFPGATQWGSLNQQYWSVIRESSPDNLDKRAKVIVDGYNGYQSEIQPEVMQHSWCYSFYYTFLAYAILLDCSNYYQLVVMTEKLQAAGHSLRQLYFSSTAARIAELAQSVPSIASRVEFSKTVIDLFSGRHLIWTNGGFRGISAPGVETCCDKKSVVVLVDGLSFPVVVRDFDETKGEGWIAGCALIRGVDMQSRDTETATLPVDYKRGKKRVFRFR